MMREVSLPQNIRVHLGEPGASAPNITVNFRDYIKNVASSEIYADWPNASLEANILVEISYALNRIYTEWYPSKGYPFDITNSTAYDQYFVKDRLVFSEISAVVDQLWTKYLRRQGHKEPYFSSYCNGSTSTCAGLSQWGTVTLAQCGWSTMQILKYYYPKDIEIAVCDASSTAVPSYPGYPLREGSIGENTKNIQYYLNRIREDWPIIPKIAKANGFFCADTTAAVKTFQSIFDMSSDGYVGKNTWYKISEIYTAVKKLSELDSEGEFIGISAAPPTVIVREGAKNEYVVQLQFILNALAQKHPIETVLENARFDEQTLQSVMSFQKHFGLMIDGVVGPATWNKLHEIYKNAYLY